ncbi:hypothetical protein [Shewanella sp. TB4-MNA-CIBAN-0142]|uniref:hypothetical protein n=1 Tax=Shewanella sp. TB4-MNA-CIBAN-0142 TaxID=3140464 RepID=UPI00331C82DD
MKINKYTLTILGEPKKSQKTPKELVSEKIYFYVKDEKGNKFALLVNGEYFASGIQSIAEYSSTIVNEVSFPIQALIRVLPVKNEFNEWASVPLVIRKKTASKASHPGEWMNISEIYILIREISTKLPVFFDGVEINFPLEQVDANIGNWSNPNNMGMLVTGDNIGSYSGVYFFARPNGEIFYIGKAASLHHRIWDHVKTPVTLSDGNKVYPKHGFRCSTSVDEIESIASGKSLLGVATISDPDLVSFIEVYLHTAHIKKHGKLPSLNKQIG